MLKSIIQHCSTCDFTIISFSMNIYRCFSFIGRVGGPQDISIGQGCEFKGIVMHEMFHALGRWHEQSRPDRDQFVRILTQNIRSGKMRSKINNNIIFWLQRAMLAHINSERCLANRCFVYLV